MTKIFDISTTIKIYVTSFNDTNTNCQQCGYNNIKTDPLFFLILHPTRKDMPLQELLECYRDSEKVDIRCLCETSEMVYNTLEIMSYPPCLLIQLGQLGVDRVNNAIPEPIIYIDDIRYYFKAAFLYDGFINSDF